MQWFSYVLRVYGKWTWWANNEPLFVSSFKTSYHNEHLVSQTLWGVLSVWNKEDMINSPVQVKTYNKAPEEAHIRQRIRATWSKLTWPFEESACLFVLWCRVCCSSLRWWYIAFVDSYTFSHALSQYTLRRFTVMFSRESTLISFKVAPLFKGFIH